MNLLRIILIILFVGISFSACSGNSLLNQNQNSDTSPPPPTRLFAQIQTPATSPDFEIEHYRIHLDQAGLVLGNIKFLGVNSQTIQAQHEGHEHEEESEDDSENHTEPSSCDYQNSFNKFIYLNLLQNTSFPCIEMPSGNYQGLEFEFPESLQASETLLLPMGTSQSLLVRGSALHLESGRLYSFLIQGNLGEKIRLTQNLILSGEAHHLKIEIEVSDWFHGIDFSSLEELPESVVREISVENNSEIFEHFLEHLLDSLSIQIEN